MKMFCLWINSKSMCQIITQISKKQYYCHFPNKIDTGICTSIARRTLCHAFAKTHMFKYSDITIEFHIPINIVINGLDCTGFFNFIQLRAVWMLRLTGSGRKCSQLNHKAFIPHGCRSIVLQVQFLDLLAYSSRAFC